ncbi:proline--tRNA ligase, partial [Escherichia coli]|nr:proline--tRNA ligase [Escherichia coli]
VHDFCNELAKQLERKFRVRLDSTDKSPGYKASNSEIQGVPLRIEVGPKDLENQTVTIVRRDTLEKTMVSVSDVKSKVREFLNSIHNNLY